MSFNLRMDPEPKSRQSAAPKRVSRTAAVFAAAVFLVSLALFFDAILSQLAGTQWLIHQASGLLQRV
jgi:hypothetical protein